MKDDSLNDVRDPGNAYELYNREVAYDGNLFKVLRDHIRLPNGLETTHEILRYPGSVSIIPLLEEEPGRRELILLEQFRSSVGGYIYEIPAGMLEEGEDPLDCAKRELEEETGYRAARWTPVSSFLATPGIAPGRMHYFLAEELELTGEQKLDPGECLTVFRFPLNGLVDSLVFGKTVEGIPPIADGKTHVAVFFLGSYLRETKP